MADIVRLERVTQLPDVPIVDTVYYVQTADGEIAQQFVVGNDGMAVPVSLDTTTVQLAFSRATEAIRRLDVLNERDWTLERFGADPFGLRDSSDEVATAIAASLIADRPIFLSGGKFRVSTLPSFSIPDGKTLRLIGGGGSKFDGLGKSSPMFTFGAGGGSLIFEEIETSELTLFYDNQLMTKDIPLIDIRGWKSRIAGEKFSACLANITTDANRSVLRQLIAKDIDGVGGLGGLHMRVQLMKCLVTGTWSDTAVPNTDAHFNSSNAMVGTGYNAGLNLGRENDIRWYPGDAADRIVGPFTVQNVRDNRVQRGDAPTTNCDGMRFIGNFTWGGQLTAKKVSSAYRTDTTGIYCKTQFTLPPVVIEDCGAHEAAMTFKGLAEGEGDGTFASPDAWPMITGGGVIRSTTPGFNNRAALYLAPDQMRLGDYFIQRMGGDVEDPRNPGLALSGTQGVIYQTSSPFAGRRKGDFKGGNQKLLECTVAGRGRVVYLNGCKTQVWDSFDFERIANGLFSTQAPGDEPNLSMIYIDTPLDIEQIVINQLVARDLVKNGKTATMLRVGNAAGRLKRLLVRSGYCDSTVDNILTFDGQGADFVHFSADCEFGAAANAGLGYVGGTPPADLIIQDRTFSYGPDLLANGDMSSDTIWTKGARVSITGGRMVFTAGASSAAGIASQSVAGLQEGKTYFLELDTIDTSGGQLTPSLQGGTVVQQAAFTNAAGVRRQSRVFTAGAGNTTLQLQGGTSFAGAIDNVRLRQRVPLLFNA